MKRAGQPGWIGRSHSALARMEKQTRRAVLAEMRPVQELAARAGRTVEEMRRDLRQWTAEGRIFSVKDQATEYFPPFALDPDAGYRPYPAVAEMLSILHELQWDNAWGLAGWFVGVNGYLDVQRPMDVLVNDPEWVIDAAQDAVTSEKYPHG